MSPPAPYKEPRMCQIPVTLLSFILLLSVTLLSIVEQFVFSDCGTALSIVAQSVNLIVSIVGLGAFFGSVLKRSEQWMLLVLLSTFIGMLQSIMVVVMALMTAAGSDTCISIQLRSWNTTCIDSKSLTCDIFNSQVQRDNGDRNGAIFEYSTFICVYASILAIIYGFAYAVHFKLFKSFLDLKRQQTTPSNESFRPAMKFDDVTPDLPKYIEAMGTTAPPPSYDNTSRVSDEDATIEPPPYHISVPDTI